MAFRNPSLLANAMNKQPKTFVLDKEKYPDVQVSPYGFIYNIGNASITDVAAQNKKMGLGGGDGFTVTTDYGEELYYPTWEEAYNFVKGGK